MRYKKNLAQQQLQIDLLQEKTYKTKIEKSYDLSESRLYQLENTQHQIKKDLKSFHLHANKISETLSKFKKSIEMMEAHLNSQNHRLNALSNLKSTINSISEAIDQTSQSYTVKPGDTLEKIARQHQTSVKKIKQINNLNSNTIFVGQKLKIS